MWCGGGEWEAASLGGEGRSLVLHVALPSGDDGVLAIVCGPPLGQRLEGRHVGGDGGQAGGQLPALGAEVVNNCDKWAASEGEGTR